jgi:hypothetical protein
MPLWRTLSEPCRCCPPPARWAPPVPGDGTRPGGMLGVPRACWLPRGRLGPRPVTGAAAKTGRPIPIAAGVMVETGAMALADPLTGSCRCWPADAARATPPYREPCPRSTEWRGPSSHSGPAWTSDRCSAVTCQDPADQTRNGSRRCFKHVYLPGSKLRARPCRNLCVHRDHPGLT